MPSTSETGKSSAQTVKYVMTETSKSLSEASKHVKEHGLHIAKAKERGGARLGITTATLPVSDTVNPVARQAIRGP